jgi:hypothetical protein
LRAVLKDHPDEHEPLKLLGTVEQKVRSMAADFMIMVGSEGKAA